MPAATRIAYLALCQVPHPERPETYFREIAVQHAPSMEREVVGQTWDDQTVAVFVARMSGPKAPPTVISVWLSRGLRVPICAAECDMGPKATLVQMFRRMYSAPLNLWQPNRNGPPTLSPSGGRTDVS